VLRRQEWIEVHARRLGGLDTAAWANP
jgi:hypothetical protein